MREKRGQITVFIIIGIFLLAAVAVFLYLKQDRTGLEIEQAIPEEFMPIKHFVEECIQKYAQQGILLMGVQGG
ncbi:hypothetical protein HYS48_04595, partial [Candidatus Woesearchaeota archaeon]|nr:hypothetical protein [Candidatus Woesearchaeota archaeon]